jgi:heme-degrading monooxygenase HmoA
LLFFIRFVRGPQVDCEWAPRARALAAATPANPLQEKAMAVTLINVFNVPSEREDEFLGHWRQTASFFRDAPGSGFIETHLHKNTGIGNPTFTFINIARWQSGEHWKRSHDAYVPKEYSVPGVKGHPAIFESIVDLFGAAKTDSRETFLNIPARDA